MTDALLNETPSQALTRHLETVLRQIRRSGRWSSLGMAECQLRRAISSAADVVLALTRADARVAELEARLIEAGQEISAMASESQQATAMLMAAGEHAARLRSERDDLERRLSVLLERQGAAAHTAHAEGAIPAEVAEVIARACEPWRRDGGIGGGTR